MSEQLHRFTAVLEPNSQRIFDAYIEEMPNITTSGVKISVIMIKLKTKLAKSLKTDPENIVLALSVRVKID